jgi:tetratricopeptide (TPR) repeat protein
MKIGWSGFVIVLVFALFFAAGRMSNIALCQQAAAGAAEEFGRVTTLAAQGNNSEAAERIIRFLKDNPKDPMAPDFLMQLGRAYEQMNRWADAEQAFRRLFTEWAEDPRAADAMAAAAQNAARDNRRDDAIKLFEQALERFPDASAVLMARFDLAGLYEKRGKADAAARLLLDAAKKNDPYSLRAKYELVQLYTRQGNYYEAETALGNYIKDYPDDDSMKLNLGQLFMKEGKPEQAIPIYDELMKKQPGNIGIEDYQFQAYKAAGRLDELIQNLEKQEKKSAGALAPVKKLKQLYLWNNDSIGALNQLEIIVAKEPDNFDDTVTLARLYYQNQWVRKAKELLRGLIGRHPDLSMAWAHLGAIEYAEKQYDEARKAFEKAARFDPDDPLSYQRLADYYRQFKVPAEIAKIYEDGRASLNRKTLFSRELADLYYSQMQFKDALTEYLNVLINEPGDVLTHDMIIDLLNRDELKDEGYAAVMRTALDVPQNIELNLLAAEVMMMRGETDAAVKRLEALSSSAPNNAFYSQLGLRLLARGEPGGAAALFELAADREQGDRAGRLIQAGRAWQSAGDPGKAEPDYTRIIDTMPDAPGADEALFRLAGIAEDKNDFLRVQALYSQFVSQYPLSAYAGEAFLGEAKAELRLGEFDKAMQAFDALADQPRARRFADEIYFYRAELRLLDNKKDEAQKLYRQLVDQYPESGRVADAINRLLFLDDTDSADPINVGAYLEAEKKTLTGDSAGAEGLLRGLAVSLPTGPLQAYAQFRLGELLESEKRDGEAAEYFKRTADDGGLTDLRQSANVRLAAALARLGKKEDALKRYQAVIMEDPRSYWAQRARAEAAQLQATNQQVP